MSESFLSLNLLQKYALYLTFDEIYMLGSLCRSLRTRIRKNGLFWKTIIISICPNPLWSKLKLEDDDYIQIAIENKKPWTSVKELLFKELQRQYILYRLRLPMSNKEALRICMVIETPNIPAPHNRLNFTGELNIDDDHLSKRINLLRENNLLKKKKEIIEPDEWTLKYFKGLTPSQMVEEPKEIKQETLQNLESEQIEKDLIYEIVLKKNEPFFFWGGEGEHFSNFKIYCVDRLKPGPIDVKNIGDFIYIRSVDKKKTTLSNKDYLHISKILNNNPEERNKSDVFDDLLGRLGGKKESRVIPYIHWKIKINFSAWFDSLIHNVPIKTMK